MSRHIKSKTPNLVDYRHLDLGRHSQMSDTDQAGQVGAGPEKGQDGAGPKKGQDGAGQEKGQAMHMQPRGWGDCSGRQGLAL